LAEKPEILIASKDDWANVGYLLQEALRAVGRNAKAIALKPHQFNYEKQADVVNAQELDRLASEASVIINMHSVEVVQPYAEDDPRHFLVFHGGSAYRDNVTNRNAVFNRYVKASLVQTSDLLGRGAKHETWLLPPIDLANIKPHFGIQDEQIKVAHYPRNAKDKHSDVINGLMDKLGKQKAFRDRFIYTFSDATVKRPANLARMAACDIYVELFGPDGDPRTPKHWGMTALEAAALGKVVVTCFADEARYVREYGPCALQVANTERELDSVMKRLLSMDYAALELLQVQSREWVERYHSYAAVGARLSAAIDRHCFGKVLASTTSRAAKIGRVEKPPKRTVHYDPQTFWETKGKDYRLPAKFSTDEHYAIMDLCNRHLLLPMSWLEVGSGIGETYGSLKRKGYKLENYQAADFAHGCRNRFRETHHIMPAYWDGKTLPFPDNSTDIVLSTDVMQFVPDGNIVGFIAEHARVAKRYVLVGAFIGGSRTEPPWNVTVHDYEQLWEEAGLTVVQRRVTGDGTRSVWLLEKRKARPVPDAVVEIQDEDEGVWG